MKKLILASFATLAILPATAMAQPGRPPAHEMRRDHHDARQNYDRRDDSRRAVHEYNRANPWRAAPFRYHRFDVGARIRPAYFASPYVVRDYQRFRWSRPGANQRWIRHYDDALLVNTRTGRVVKVIHNAFR